MTAGCVAGSTRGGGWLADAGAVDGVVAGAPDSATKALAVNGAVGTDSPQPAAMLQAVAIEAAITRREYISPYSTGQLVYRYILADLLTGFSALGGFRKRGGH